MEDHLLIFVFIIFIINGFGFMMMGVDKQRAKTKQWRISERSLFLIALLGGALGVFAGLKFFRHKTKKALFLIGLPLIIGIHFMLVILYFL
ncbi:uncharacterized membrane protein YsdA (DUF1294 family) [Evansella vedderi]|uniref:Uncharacterized membrane protein YsdA (DUF1294 family) n=1 Tax=Evansella vedderi TaxID=38282 RepID=A0ABU0A3L2_9BACI|nr:DUF1294 domain-containing protein [Evansella vedderi]MDQ0258081.1 uncharacterized membrane protein YsdA (DUF1294 family) [Evansella vedderi]